MSERIEITLTAEELFRYLEEVDQRVQETEENAEIVLEAVKEDSSAAFNQVLSMARGSYLLSLGMVKAMGGSVTYMFRSMISGMFATISALKAVALGKAMTTMDWISFAMEMGQLGLALTATVLAEQGQMAAGRAIMGAKMSLMGLSQLIGVMSF